MVDLRPLRYGEIEHDSRGLAEAHLDRAHALARELDAVALVPAVVVRDELRDGRLEEYCAVPDLFEEFHAISVTRQYQPPLLRTLLARRATEVLGGSE